ncbi:hypothetical protein FGE12_22225 [Aggregicoccus sp. 17bor-14]|uniref:hypothetical protein n=1 Tax=Myxococcaceae TaxID=31 RepID=UPI00129CC115|nr:MULTISPECIES: hypothetical protein [Myxococcaceae]MBF5045136.1 hypothetical protein [Simulacricoccus sp. 17bor-14]MRI90878.1 hypothetical protein [Aggregicoccus sp. 17bor-14]
MRALASCLILLSLWLAGCSDFGRENFPVTPQGTHPVVALRYAPSGERLFVAGAHFLSYSPDGRALGRALDVTLVQLAVTQQHVYGIEADPYELLLFDYDGACLSCAPETRIPGTVALTPGYGSLVASADGSTVVAALVAQEGAAPQVVRLVPGATGAQALGAVLYTGEVRALTLSPDGALLLLSLPGGQVEARDAHTGEVRWHYAGGSSAERPPVAAVYWTTSPAPFAALAATLPLQPLGTLDPATGALTLLDAEQRGLQLSHDAPPVATTQDGRFLFGREEVGQRRQVGALSRYDVQRRAFAPLLEQGAFNALALSPDGARLAVSRGTEIATYSVEELLGAPALSR